MLRGLPVSRLSIAMTSWPSREEPVAEMAAEEPGAAGDEDSHGSRLACPSGPCPRRRSASPAARISFGS